MDAIFTAGSAQVDITPPLGTLMNGEFVAYYARHVHDPLFSKALVMNDGKTTIALVMADICAMQMDYINEIRASIAASTGIAPANILIAATHTHFAGSVADLLGTPVDHAYRVQLARKIKASVEQAMKAMRPARSAHVSVDVPEHAVCRRYYMKPGYVAANPVTGGIDRVKTNPVGAGNEIEGRAAVPDTELSAIAVQSLEGEWIALLANYSMHYVGDCPHGTITADYFGVFSRGIAGELGAGPSLVAMLSNGTSGDVNIRDVLHPNRYPEGYFEKSEMIGKDLAARLAAALKKVTWASYPALSAKYLTVTVKVRKPSAAELKRAGEIVSITDYRLLQPDADDSMIRIYAREQVLLNEYPASIEFPVQAIRIGDVAIGGLGGEFFAETGLLLKKAAGSLRYFTITMANGYIGYIPPAHEIEKGGYETWRCRTSFLQPEAEHEIRAALMQLLGVGQPAGE